LVLPSFLFETDGDYVCIVSGKRRLLKQETLSDLETLLDGAG
jgi:hypothetical protein